MGYFFSAAVYAAFIRNAAKAMTTTRGSPQPANEICEPKEREGERPIKRAE